MARLARFVIPDLPYHVTRRGNGRQRTFFEEAGYALCLDLLAQAAERARRLKLPRQLDGYKDIFISANMAFTPALRQICPRPGNGA